MKKYLLILTLLVFSITGAFAQETQPGDDNKPVDIKALYVAYVTQQLQLTSDEAQKFWPVHAQFENDLKSVKKDLPELERQQARLDIKKRYQDSFGRIIGNTRSESFFRMDGEFKKKLLERVRKQRANQQKQNARPWLRGGQ